MTGGKGVLHFRKTQGGHMTRLPDETPGKKEVRFRSCHALVIVGSIVDIVNV